MTVLYADSSALIRAYFEDEEDHQLLREMLLEGREEPVVTSELARVELASAARSATTAGRIEDAASLHARIEAQFGSDGSVILLQLRPATILPAAERFVRDHKLRTLDAIHLAVALEEAPAFALDGEVVLVTRDDDQAAAARALGLAVR